MAKGQGVEGGGLQNDADAAMTRYAQGDEAAFSIVYDHVSRRIFAYVVRQGRTAADAEDLLQQTLLHLHRGRASFAPGMQVLPWAFAIARRLLIDSFRKQCRESRLRQDAADLSTPPAHQEMALAIKEMQRELKIRFSSLPDSQKSAFLLVKEEGLSLAEAAEVLGTTVTAVKLRIHRASGALRDAIRDQGEDDALGS